MFSVLESVAFDTGYAGSAGLVPQSWVNGNGTSYIYFRAGEFDGQGSGHDYLCTLVLPWCCWCPVQVIQKESATINMKGVSITVEKIT